MKNKSLRRNEIIKSSIDLMHLKGYNGTSVKDITDAAGIPKGSFYNYFNDKEKYVIDALDYYYYEIGKDRFMIFKDTSLRPLDRIRKFYTDSIERLEKKGLKYGCFGGNITEEMADVNVTIGEAVAIFHKRIVDLIYSNLVEAFESGDLKSTIDLKTLADFIVNSWQGAMLRMKATGTREPLDEFYIIMNANLLR